MRHLSLLNKAFTLLLFILLLSSRAERLSAEPWKFGVMGDSQWTTSDPAHANPSTVPLTIINQVNRQFIREGVKFVIQVGDLSDDGRDGSERTRAAAAQPLIDAGIGFFAVRGNHECTDKNNNYGTTGFRSNYPQTRTGWFTKSSGEHFQLGTQFSSPTMVSMELDGLSYAFDYGDPESRARFVLIDPWVTPANHENKPYGYTIHEQQAWISDRLDKNRRGTLHAFVFSHQPIIAENHQDGLFSGYTNAHPDWQNTFFASLQRHGVKYVICGHDHIHQRSIIASPDGSSRIEEIISASNSTKFYAPKPLDDSLWFGQKIRETSISQERNSIGYYIYTIDGPSVRVDYYADDHGNWHSDGHFPNGKGRADNGLTPNFNFVEKESWGYYLNGKEYLIPQGASYTVVSESFKGTVARIVDGSNQSTARDGTLDRRGGIGRRLGKVVATGWIDQKRWQREHPALQRNHSLALVSPVFMLSGLGELGSAVTDRYVLSMSYFPATTPSLSSEKMFFGLAATDADGNWVNAVNKNIGGTGKFIAGPWKKEYGLGSYGIDLKTGTAWAVINYNGEFAVAGFKALKQQP